MPWARHAKVIAFASKGKRNKRCKVPGQSLGGGPGGGAQRSSENSGVSNSKNGLKS